MADPLVPYGQEQALLNYLMSGGGGFMPVTMDPAAFQLTNMLSNAGAPGWGSDFKLEDEGAEVDFSGNRTQLSGVMNLLADPMLRGIAGAGAFQPGTFNPTVEFGDVDSSLQESYRNARRWQNVGGIEGLTARKAAIGASPSQIMNDVMTMAALEPGTEDFDLWLSVQEDPELAKAEYDEVQNSLPTFATNQPNIGTASTWGPGVQEGTQLDTSTLQGIISDVYADVSAGTDIMGNLYDPEANPGGMYVDEGGMLRTRQEVPSAMAQHFDELGLPYPTEEYGLDFLAKNAPDVYGQWEMANQQQAMADQYLAQAEAARARQMPTNVPDPTEAWGYNAGRTDEVPVGPGGETGGDGGGGKSGAQQVLDILTGPFVAHGADWLADKLNIGGGDEIKPRNVRGNDNAVGGVPSGRGRAGRVTYDIPDPEEELAKMQMGGSWAAVDQAIADNYNSPVAMAGRSNAAAGPVPMLGGRSQVNYGGQMMSPLAAYRNSSTDAARNRMATLGDRAAMMNMALAGRRPFTDALQSGAQQLSLGGVIPGY